MMEQLQKVLGRPFEKLKGWFEYRQAWEVSERRLEYKTVVKQASGYSVTVDEVVELENNIDGQTKKRRTEKGSTWVGYNNQWKPGLPVSYKGEEVQCAEQANLFGNVARGYQR